MLSEKAAYLKGLIDGLEIDDSTKEGKVLLALSDVINEICETVDCIDADVDDIVDFCSSVDEDLSDVEEEVFGETEECECDGHCCHCDDEDDDDCAYEVTCPTCGDTIELNDLMLEDGALDCPNCGEHLEFDFDDEEEDEDDGE